MDNKEDALTLFTQYAKVVMDADNEGFIIGGPAKVVPQTFVKAYNNRGLSEIPLGDYDNIDLQLSLIDLMDLKPAMAHFDGEVLTIHPKNNTK